MAVPTLGYSPPTPATVRSSVLAITAFTATMLAPVGFVALLFLTLSGWFAPSAPIRFALAIMFVGAPLVGAILGLVDLFLPRRRRLLAGMSLLLSGIILLLYAIWFLRTV
jgi:hypothetical protein